MRQWKGCTWALCLLFLLLRPSTGSVLPQETNDDASITNKPVLEPIFSRDVAPAIRNPVPMEEVMVSSTAAPVTTTTRAPATTTVKPTVKNTPKTTAKTTPKTTAKTTSAQPTRTTTEAPLPTTTTNRYKLYLRALGLLNRLLTTKSLPLLNTSNTTSTIASTSASTHAGFFSHPSVVATTATPATSSSYTAITSQPRSHSGQQGGSVPERLESLLSVARASNGDHLRSFLNNFFTHNRINNRSNYNSKRMLHSDVISSSSSRRSGDRGNATHQAMAIGILRALWDDFSHNNSTDSGAGTKYVPIALTAPASSGLSTAKAIVIESSKNKILPYPPSNLITIHNFHPSVDELRPTRRPTQHLFHPTDYDNWDEINQSASHEDGSDNSISHSQEIMSQLPISITRTPAAHSSKVTVRPLKVKNQVQPLRVQIVTSHDVQEEDNDVLGSNQEQHVGNYEADNQNSASQLEEEALPSTGSNKPQKKKTNKTNKVRKKTIKNKTKKSPVSPTTSTTTTSSMIVVAEEEYGVQDPEDVLDDEPVDPDLETHQPEIDRETAVKEEEQHQQQMEEGPSRDQVIETVHSEYCPRSNKFSADRDDRCIRRMVQHKKRPKKKFHTDDWDDLEASFDDDNDDDHTVDPLSRHGEKIKPPKIKVPKIKVPKVKPPKVHLSMKDMPTMMAMMKTFMTGVSMATMYNPMNFGLWSVVLHPVTMMVMGLGGLLMYCFPWTTVAMLTSRKYSGDTIEVHRYGRRIGSPKKIVRYESSPARPEWLEDQAGWILGVINNYTFQTDL